MGDEGRAAIRLHHPHPSSLIPHPSSPMYYSIRHVNEFRYTAPVRESVMEARMQPRSDGTQRCVSFVLTIEPRTRVMTYQDYLGNVVHHFDIPGHHDELTITAEATVEILPSPPLPPALDAGAWSALDDLVARGDYWEFLLPSHFARPTDLLHDLARELDLRRRDDPLTTLRDLNNALYNTFSYVKASTRVDSPIDEALRNRQGVCQDYTHILIALVRQLRIPCRYVSGYLYHSEDAHDRSEDGATHAWAEALLPEVGWVGLDPVNNLITGDRHTRVAIGRDYADVPPTRGVYKKDKATVSALKVQVQVSPVDAPPQPMTILPPMPSTVPVATTIWSGFIRDGDEQQPEQQQQESS